MKPILKLILLVLVFLSTNNAYATHIRGGYIQYSRISTLTYQITVFILGDTESPVQAGDAGMIDFGDGTSISTQNETGITTIIGGNVSLTTFIFIHKYPAQENYTISYSEVDRNEGVVNMTNSVNTPFYVESEIVIDPFVGIKSGIRFENLPVLPNTILGSKMLFNPLAIDPDGDSLSYHFTIPKQSRDMNVADYLWLNSPEFYFNDYNIGNESQDGPPIFSINPINGNIIWDAPQLIGEYTVAMKVKSWRKILGEMLFVGSTTLDWQIIVEEEENYNRPVFTFPNSKCYQGDVSEAIEVLSDGDMIKVTLTTDAENAKLDNVPFSDYAFPTEFSRADFSVDYSLAIEDTTRAYHKVNLLIEKKNGLSQRTYSWSQSFVYDFGCENFGIITSTEKILHENFHAYFSYGEIIIKTNEKAADKVMVYLYDTSAKLLIKSYKSLQNGQIILDAQHFKSGLYIIRTESEEGFFKSKIYVN